MSAKQFKSMRRAVRMMDKDPRETSLTPTRSGRFFAGDRVLAQSCGRAIYRALKKHERTGMPA